MGFLLDHETERYVLPLLSSFKMDPMIRFARSCTMNIFVLSLNPRIAAELHCDKHVVKMILETAQLLYSVHWTLNPDSLPEFAYKKTHVNHPCAVWARQNAENYRWLCSLGYYLCKEYTFRYGKIHKTEAHIRWLIVNLPSLPKESRTPFAQAMPDEYKHSDPITAYQTFYLENKMKLRGIVRYTKRTLPDFLQC